MKKPNILLILCDDMGFSDIGCYGGEIDTPNLDFLANNGIRFSQFYNTARCCPSRASILTGLFPHQAGIGHMGEDLGLEGYKGELGNHAVTLAEVLGINGYRTYMTGKWHVAPFDDETKRNWPINRGFDRYYGIITSAANYFQPTTLVRDNEIIEPEEDYYITDAFTDEAVRQIKEHDSSGHDKPFFQYLAYNAPHWPLHALPEEIRKYKGRFSQGWDILREERMRRLMDLGIINREWRLSARDPKAEEWKNAPDQDWQQRRMEVYAAQIDRMDQGIGRVVQALKETNQYDNTLILFLSDNGGCSEEIPQNIHEMVHQIKNATEKTRQGERVIFGNDHTRMPGDENTYQSYGIAWANMSNTPFRLFKHWVHEGGIATPLIVHWPEGISGKGAIRHKPAQLPDIMATCLDAAEAEYPRNYKGNAIKPLEGFSMMPLINEDRETREVLYWEHEGNKAVRKGQWKLVCRHDGAWELYDMCQDRTEINNAADSYPEIVAELSTLYEKWAERCFVKPRDEVLKRLHAWREARRKV